MRKKRRTVTCRLSSDGLSDPQESAPNLSTEDNAIQVWNFDQNSWTLVSSSGAAHQASTTVADRRRTRSAAYSCSSEATAPAPLCSGTAAR